MVIRCSNHIRILRKRRRNVGYRGEHRQQFIYAKISIYRLVGYRDRTLYGRITMTGIRKFGTPATRREIRMRRMSLKTSEIIPFPPARRLHFHARRIRRLVFLTYGLAPAAGAQPRSNLRIFWERHPKNNRPRRERGKHGVIWRAIAAAGCIHAAPVQRRRSKIIAGDGGAVRGAPPFGDSYNCLYNC